MLIYRVRIYVFGIYKHHRTLLYSWFPTVKSLLTYSSFRRPVLSSHRTRHRCDDDDNGDGDGDEFGRRIRWSRFGGPVLTFGTAPDPRLPPVTLLPATKSSRLHRRGQLRTRHGPCRTPPHRRRTDILHLPWICFRQEINPIALTEP